MDDLSTFDVDLSPFSLNVTLACCSKWVSQESSDQFMYDGARDDTRPFDAAEGKVGPRVRFPPSETDSPNMAVTEQQRRGGREREEIGIRFRSPSRLGSFSFTLGPY